MAPQADRGAVTAEFVIVLPAVLAVLALAVGAILLATHRVTLTSAAVEVARLEARGDMDAAGRRLVAVGTEVQTSRERAGPLHCVTLRMRPAGGLLSAVELVARGCAALVEADSGTVRNGMAGPP